LERKTYATFEDFGTMELSKSGTVVMDFDDSGWMYDITKLSKKTKSIKRIKDTQGLDYSD